MDSLKNTFIFSLENEKGENQELIFLQTKAIINQKRENRACIGHYTHKNGTKVKELSINTPCEKTAVKYATEFKQECILFIDDELKGTLIFMDSDEKIEIGKAVLTTEQPKNDDKTLFENGLWLTFE